VRAILRAGSRESIPNNDNLSLIGSSQVHLPPRLEVLEKPVLFVVVKRSRRDFTEYLSGLDHPGPSDYPQSVPERSLHTDWSEQLGSEQDSLYQLVGIRSFPTTKLLDEPFLDVPLGVLQEGPPILQPWMRSSRFLQYPDDERTELGIVLEANENPTSFGQRLVAHGMPHRAHSSE
jgi:hypothetical protein